MKQNNNCRFLKEQKATEKFLIDLELYSEYLKYLEMICKIIIENLYIICYYKRENDLHQKFSSNKKGNRGWGSFFCILACSGRKQNK